MKTASWLALAWALAGCSAAAHHEMAVTIQCRQEAGPAPGQGLIILGLLGSAMQMSDPTWQAWERGVQRCKRQRLAAGL